MAYDMSMDNYYNNKRILGLDIIPSAVGEKERFYSAVLLINGEISEKYEKLSFSDIIQLIEKKKVNIIAVDNIFELASNYVKLVEIFEKLYHPVKIIQVTYINENKSLSMSTLAQIFGLERGKLSPLKTAEVCAYLAFHGIGSEVVLFEDETRIIVSRSRSLTQGGMSKERYRRNIEALILRATREIKEKLEKYNIDFDLFTKKTTYGLESSLFIVYSCLLYTSDAADE